MDGITQDEKTQLEKYKAEAETLDKMADELDAQQGILRKLSKQDPFGEDTVKQPQSNRFSPSM